MEPTQPFLRDFSGDIAAPLGMVQLRLSSWLEDHSANIPMLPRVASQVLELAGSDESSHRELANLIQSDQALASWVMKVANSAAFNMENSVVTLQQAITRLGMEMISDIALSATTQMKLFRSERYQYLMNTLSQEALTQGLWAREIARQLRGNVESAFLCGLLQTIGKPLVLLALSDIQEQAGIELADNDAVDLLESFKTEFGVAISRQWGLPEIIYACIQYSDDFHKAANHSNMVLVVNSAAHFMQAQLDPEHYSVDELKQRESVAALNLYQDDIESLLEKFSEISDKTAALRLS